MRSMNSTVQWGRLSALRTPVLVLAALILITVGAFHSPYAWLGWVVAGLSVLFLAYVTDTTPAPAAEEIAVPTSPAGLYQNGGPVR
jgi:energy-converting hydrogenase Eha subunit A